MRCIAAAESERYRHYEDSGCVDLRYFVEVVWWVRGMVVYLVWFGLAGGL